MGKHVIAKSGQEGSLSLHSGLAPLKCCPIAWLLWEYPRWRPPPKNSMFCAILGDYFRIYSLMPQAMLKLEVHVYINCPAATRSCCFQKKLMSLAQFVTDGHMDVFGLACCLRSFCYLWAFPQEEIFLWVSCEDTWGYLDIHGPCCYQELYLCSWSN